MSYAVLMLRRVLASITTNPWINLAAGTLLFACGLSETLEGLDQDFKLGVHHGVLVAGLLEVLDAAEKLLAALEARD